MGKSTLAQRIAMAQGGARYYIATMVPRDSEDDARVARHRAERHGQGFTTIECARGIRTLRGTLPPDASLLLDSVTSLLAEEMFGADGTFNPSAADHVKDDLLCLLDSFAHIVLVSDMICADGCRYDATTEAYRRALAAIDRALVKACDLVVEMAFGVPIAHKGDAAALRLLHTLTA